MCPLLKRVHERSEQKVDARGAGANKESCFVSDPLPPPKGYRFWMRPLLTLFCSRSLRSCRYFTYPLMKLNEPVFDADSMQQFVVETLAKLGMEGQEVSGG